MSIGKFADAIEGVISTLHKIAMLQAYVARTGMKPIDVFDKLNVYPLRSTRARAF